MNPIKNILNKYGIVILDGAFSTELERKGYNINDLLWSAKFLIENPLAISEVHSDYYYAGADCATTSSYQATYEGFSKRGLSEEESEKLIKLSVSIAIEARDKFWEIESNRINRPKPLVAASVGPYGAYLADGSEYIGNYKIGEEELKDFHRKRMRTLIEASPDILACETIPCLSEAKAIATLLKEFPETYAWISFSAKDGKHINSGEKIADCAQLLDKYEQIAAIGINCTPPQHIESLIEEIRSVTNKPIIVYPNSGQIYNANTKTWNGNSNSLTYGEMAYKWYQKGAKLIGGCCKTSPEDIAQIAKWARK